MVYILQFETNNRKLLYKYLRTLHFLLLFFLRSWVFLVCLNAKSGQKCLPRLKQIFLNNRRTHFAIIRSAHIFNRSKEHFIRHKYKIIFYIKFFSFISSRDGIFLRNYIVSFCLYFLPSFFAFKLTQRSLYYL